MANITRLLRNQPLVEPQNPLGAVATFEMYRFLDAVRAAIGIGEVAGVSVSASPFSYVADGYGSVIVSGGTVSAIAFSRDGTTFFATGQTAGMFRLNTGDTLRVTYTVLPTLTFVPG